jgi:hypothetical protein
VQKQKILQESLLFNFLVHEDTFRAYFYQSNFQKKVGQNLFGSGSGSGSGHFRKSVLDPVNPGPQCCTQDTMNREGQRTGYRMQNHAKLEPFLLSEI